MTTETGERCECEFVGIEDENDIARVFIDGYELPRVGFDKGRLTGAGLVPGQWFSWSPQDGSIRADVKDPAAAMDPADLAELERLMEESKKWGPFPIYTGDGD